MLYNLAADRQPQACTWLAIGFSLYLAELFKHQFLSFRGNPWPVVNNFNSNAFLCIL